MDSVRQPGVIDKAFGVLDALRDGPLTLAELQARTGLPRATAHRLAGALEEHGMVGRDPVGRFRLGLGLVALGRAAAEQFSIGDLATPALTALRDGSGESVQLYVREGGARRCVVSLQSPHGLRWIVPVGSVLPLELGSAGKVLRGVLGRRGWADSVEEREPGVASVSAPVRDGGGAIVAAVSVSGPVERLSRQPGRRFGDAVVATAATIEDELAASSV